MKNDLFKSVRNEIWRDLSHIRAATLSRNSTDIPDYSISGEIYEQDMNESADRAVAIINALKAELKQTQLMFIAAVASNGGKLNVALDNFTKADALKLVRHNDLQNNSIVFTVHKEDL